ncbi:sensor histidine kinase [Actinoallomurus sp. NBC_01490]|uniref:sensor histidine kinase n=1 Tax=Actinoallomurus sp. NBC_01490 TaxID=2903557 RepID=UPI002E3742A5|nr:sensor histidine kinase [Actinoallomurus sp. NBC_01490]
MSALVPFDPEEPSAAHAKRRALWTSLGLVYLFVWPAGSIFGHGHTTVDVVVRVAALLSYIACFIGLVVTNNPWTGGTNRVTYVLLGVTTALAIGYPLLFGGEWCGLPIYLGVAYAMTLPMRWAARGVLAATVLTFVLCASLGASGGTLALLTFETLTIGLMMMAFRASRMLVVQLREARGEVARLAANEERLRIARDLHDLLGHTLSLIVLKSEVATRLAERDLDRSVAEIHDIETVARQALADVREAISGYRQRNLTDELENARSVLAADDVELTIKAAGTPLPDPVDGLFGWAVREGVTNIVRHAHAHTATISVRRQDATAVLEIVDDGAGEAATGETPAGNGLRGLSERVTASGGTVDAGPRPDGGFRLTVRAPLTAPAPREPAEESA